MSQPPRSLEGRLQRLKSIGVQINLNGMTIDVIAVINDKLCACARCCDGVLKACGLDSDTDCKSIGKAFIIIFYSSYCLRPGEATKASQTKHVSVCIS